MIGGCLPALDTLPLFFNKPVTISHRHNSVPVTGRVATHSPTLATTIHLVRYVGHSLICSQYIAAKIDSIPLVLLGVLRFFDDFFETSYVNPLKPELIPVCYLLTLLGAHHFLHVSRIRVKFLTFRLLMSYIYGAPILDVSRSHTTTQHSR